MQVLEVQFKLSAKKGTYFRPLLKSAEDGKC